MTKSLMPFVRKRVRAFLGATVVTVALWLVAVLSVNLFAASPSFGDRGGRLVKGVERFPRGPSPHKNGPVVVFLHNTGGNPSNFTAWHTVVQVLILITLAALVIAGLDQLRRKNRRRRRLRTA